MEQTKKPKAAKDLTFGAFGLAYLKKFDPRINADGRRVKSIKIKSAKSAFISGSKLLRSHPANQVINSEARADQQQD